MVFTGAAVKLAGAQELGPSDGITLVGIDPILGIRDRAPRPRRHARKR
jgi:hypothetical protein